MANVIDYVELAVDDLGQAKAFYAKALGWTFNDYGPDYAGIQDPRNPGQEFGGLSPVTPASRGEGVLALVRTENVEDALASVLAAGGRVRGRAARVSGWAKVHVRRPIRERSRGLPAKRVDPALGGS